MDLCPLCDRELGDKNVDEHHLIPKSTLKGTKAKTDPSNLGMVHKICHRKIHATFTEKELRDDYNTWDQLKAHPLIAAFIKWVAKKEPSFYSGSDETNTSKKKRRR